jgi:ABC-2 type transport system permease protein
MTDLGEAWNGGQPLLKIPVLVVLYGVGAVGYLTALRTFTRRDLPAPL